MFGVFRMISMNIMTGFKCNTVIQIRGGFEEFHNLAENAHRKCKSSRNIDS